jgi:hypothetical protein
MTRLGSACNYFETNHDYPVFASSLYKHTHKDRRKMKCITLCNTLPFLLTFSFCNLELTDTWLSFTVYGITIGCKEEMEVERSYARRKKK